MEHGKFTKWKWLPFYPENIKIGENVDIGALTCLFGHHGIEIHDNVQIGSHCSIYSLDTERDIKGKIIITEGVKVGAHSVILPKQKEVHYVRKNVKAGSLVY